MIKLFSKHAVALAVLAGASFGANANTVTPLGNISATVPTTFTGTVLGSEQTFMDTFTFTLPQDNISSGYNVINFPVNLGEVGSLGTIFASMALITYGEDGQRGTPDDTVLTSIDTSSPAFDQENLSLSWGQNISGPAYLLIGGATSGTLGGIYTGSIAAAIPEPETYAMLLAGLGLMGAVVRRRGMRKTS